ncbi:Fatty acid hydroxylase superfamily [Chromobacterium violaceum]|uniref:Fatty acid hydroxylase superfamily n=1 Tax=Chromobacterium violaceum TaxID=536 RepID=A0A447TD98_CHRVL|nr:Fatty acid hydroxylase superfamily [Chromobacterium violaceum]
MELYAFPALAILFVGIFTREVIAPASKNRCDRRWLLLASALGGCTAAVTLALGGLFAAQIDSVALIPAARGWPDILVGAASFLLTSFAFYWWHRATHASDLLWRLFHQLHHSPRRVEALTAFYAHPLDSAAAVLISAFSSYLVLGASPIAAAWALFFTSGFDLFLHGDMKTRAGWAISSSARKCIPSTTPMGTMLRITACPCGICCLAPGAIRRREWRAWASMSTRRTTSMRCCYAATCTRAADGRCRFYDLFSSSGLPRLRARGCAPSYTLARCWKSSAV